MVPSSKHAEADEGVTETRGIKARFLLLTVQTSMQKQTKMLQKHNVKKRGFFF
jgi:hypothetical protein